MIIRLILIVIIVFLLYRIIQSLFSSPRTQRTSDYRTFFRSEKRSVNEMVQDPHCGIYLDRKEAYACKVAEKVLYFCSEECHKKYLHKK